MKPIHIVSHDENYGIRRELTDRAARIDILPVGESSYAWATADVFAPDVLTVTSCDDGRVLRDFRPSEFHVLNFRGADMRGSHAL